MDRRVFGYFRSGVLVAVGSDARRCGSVSDPDPVLRRLFASESALNFVNAILPSLGTDKQIGRISGSGAAFGYWGGVTSLFILLLLFVESPDTGLTMLGISPVLGLDPATMEGTRSVGPFIALWYVIFMIPFFAYVRDTLHLWARARRY